jgi:hypothetical protein
VTVHVSPVGHAQQVVVAAGGDPVASADPLPGPGCDHAGVVDQAVGDQLVPDGCVEGGGLLKGVRHEGDPVTPVEGRGHSGRQRRLQRGLVGV